MVPDRDLLDCTKSRGAVDDPTTIGKGYEDVVSELVLLHHVSWMDRRRLLTSPREDLVEPLVSGDLLLDSLELVRGDLADAAERYLRHGYAGSLRHPFGR